MLTRSKIKIIPIHGHPHLHTHARRLKWKNWKIVFDTFVKQYLSHSHMAWFCGKISSSVNINCVHQPNIYSIVT